MRLVLFLLLVTPFAARAGEIYGTITRNNQPVSPSRVEIICEGGHSATGTTDARGSYHLVLPREGDCTLTFQGMTAVVHSYSRAVRYDFEVVTGDGGVTLHRR